MSSTNFFVKSPRDESKRQLGLAPRRGRAALPLAAEPFLESSDSVFTRLGSEPGVTLKPGARRLGVPERGASTGAAPFRSGRKGAAEFRPESIGRSALARMRACSTPLVEALTRGEHADDLPYSSGADRGARDGRLRGDGGGGLKLALTLAKIDKVD
eukprot:scaffold13_cov241-Pinguiococcus_pyrenoidosus.AAC.11